MWRRLLYWHRDGAKTIESFIVTYYDGLIMNENVMWSDVYSEVGDVGDDNQQGCRSSELDAAW